MNKRWYISTLVTVLFMTGLCAAQASKVKIDIYEIFDPLNVLGNGSIGQVINPGTIMCPGHEPTIDATHPCPEGSNILARGTIVLMNVTSDDSRLQGTETTLINCNFHADGTGPCWGTFRKDIDEGGVWDGTWEGPRSVVSGGCVTKFGTIPCWVLKVKSIGHGTGGRVEGLEAIGTAEVYSYTLVPISQDGPGQEIIVTPAH